MKWLRSLDDDQYGYIEIGEDLTDTSYEGSPYEFGLTVERRIEIPF